MRPIHSILGYLGLIPFIGLSALHISGWQIAYDILISYSALIISFLAGVLWMSSMQAKLSASYAVLSNLIMLASWAVLWGGQSFGGLYSFSLLFITLYLIEYRTLQPHYPVEFFTLRGRLTLIATISLLAAELFS